MSPCKTCKYRFGCTIASDKEKENIKECDIYNVDENTLPKQIDWEQRRYEIAKDIVVSLLQRSGSAMCTSVDDAIRITDELIMRLKENKL